jgi:hypothetical protein
MATDMQVIWPRGQGKISENQKSIVFDVWPPEIGLRRSHRYSSRLRVMRGTENKNWKRRNATLSCVREDCSLSPRNNDYHSDPAVRIETPRFRDCVVRQCLDRRINLNSKAELVEVI